MRVCECVCACVLRAGSGAGTSRRVQRQRFRFVAPISGSKRTLDLSRPHTPWRSATAVYDMVAVTEGPPTVNLYVRSNLPARS